MLFITLGKSRLVTAHFAQLLLSGFTEGGVCSYRSLSLFLTSL